MPTRFNRLTFIGKEVCMTSTESLRSRMKGNFHVRFWRRVQVVTSVLSQHFSRNDISYASAGCLVGRTRQGHREFMSLIKKDRRYQLNNQYVFYTTVIYGPEMIEETGGVSTLLQLLKEGSSGPLVKKLQEGLKQKGFNPGSIDGVFGLGTKAAVRSFQQANGLVADGIVGQKTWNTLGLA